MKISYRSKFNICNYIYRPFWLSYVSDSANAVLPPIIPVNIINEKTMLRSCVPLIAKPEVF
ncbi:MAG: hypothetical protein QQN62_06440 [Nitrosopumilus sp.]